MSVHTYTPPSFIKSFTESDILNAALTVGSGMNGGVIYFRISDVQKQLLMPQHSHTARSSVWMDKQKIISGEKISSVLRSHPELFGTVRRGKNISHFFIIRPQTKEPLQNIQCCICCTNTASAGVMV